LNKKEEPRKPGGNSCSRRKGRGCEKEPCKVPCIQKAYANWEGKKGRFLSKGRGGRDFAREGKKTSRKAGRKGEGTRLAGGTTVSRF